MAPGDQQAALFLGRWTLQKAPLLTGILITLPTRRAHGRPHPKTQYDRTLGSVGLLPRLPACPSLPCVQQLYRLPVCAT